MMISNPQTDVAGLVLAAGIMFIGYEAYKGNLKLPGTAAASASSGSGSGSGSKPSGGVTTNSVITQTTGLGQTIVYEPSSSTDAGIVFTGPNGITSWQ